MSRERIPSIRFIAMTGPARTCLRAATIAAVLVFAACAGEDQAASAAAAARAAIASQITAGLNAVRTKNADAYLAQIPEGIDIRDSAGRSLTKAQMRDQVLRGWADLDTTLVLEVHIDTIAPHGDSASVVLTERWDRLVFHPDHKGVDTVISLKQQTEVWRKTPAGWRAFQVIPIGGSTTVNGKRIANVR